MTKPPLSDAAADLIARADELERWGSTSSAQALRTAAGEVQDAWERFWNTPLGIDQAAKWSGYSVQHLRKLRQQNVIHPCPDGSLLRRHLPIRPGHQIPLGLPPTVPDLLERSHLRRAS